MSYRFYRLKLTADTRPSVKTSEIRVHIKNINITMKSHVFDRVDPIRIFNFLTLFVSEADTLNMPEVQALITLPTFL